MTWLVSSEYWWWSKMTPSIEPEIVKWPADLAAQNAILARAAAILRSGGLVVLPTDTVYGIAALPTIPEAVRRLYALKGRPPEKAIALLIDDFAQVEQLVARVPPVARDLAQRFWPGALTIVFPAKDPQGGTVALRLPDHEVPRRLIRTVGSPMATTSANLSSQKSSVTAEDVLEQLPVGYELLIDGGRCPVGIESTVIDATTSPPRILRIGAVPPQEIEAVIGPIVVPG